VFSSLLAAVALLLALIVVVWVSWGDEVLSVLDYDVQCGASAAGLAEDDGGERRVVCPSPSRVDHMHTLLPTSTHTCACA
jgi:hypothetical protein